MDVEDVIIIDDNLSYGIVDKINFEETEYYLCVKIINNVMTTEFDVYIIDDNELIEIVNEEERKRVAKKFFSKNLKDFI